MIGTNPESNNNEYTPILQSPRQNATLKMVALACASHPACHLNESDYTGQELRNEHKPLILLVDTKIFYVIQKFCSSGAAFSISSSKLRQVSICLYCLEERSAGTF